MSAKPRTFVQRAFDPDEYDEIPPDLAQEGVLHG